MTNVEIKPSDENGLTKPSVADCLQTRPVDHRQRLIRIRGELDESDLAEIDNALKAVFSLR